VFHLATHAFFKALLFLGAGSVIHAMSGKQDMRVMGGLRKKMPITFITMATAWLAISGVFPFSGFWSKDEILIAIYLNGGLWYILWAVSMFVALLTAFYMTRLMVLTFLGEPRWDGDVHPHESPWSMTIPLIVLAFFTTTVGVFNTPFRLTFEHFLEASMEAVGHAAEAEWQLLVGLATLTLIFVFVGIFVAWKRYSAEELPVEDGGWWSRALVGFGVDDFYGKVIVAPGKQLANVASTADATVIDGAAHGIASGVRAFGDGLRPSQSGKVRGYAAMIAVASVLLIVLMVAIGGGF
jgi:NADH-quinone oxidoreductase subunit L